MFFRNFMTLAIKKYPSIVLKKKSEKITEITPEIKALAKEMQDAMVKSEGVGLAAPQVGISKRLMVIDVANEDEKRKPIVFINPVIVHKEGELVGLEGCLSFPGVYFEVKRANKITVRYQNVRAQITGSGHFCRCRPINYGNSPEQACFT